MMADRNYTYHLRSNNSVPFAYQKNYFTETECDAIIDAGLHHINSVESYVGTDNTVVNEIRRNLIGFFPSKDERFAWIHKRVTDAIKSFNQQFWNYNLDFLETLQFTRYDRPGDFYTYHMDMNHSSIEQRKLSVSIQLSDPGSYQGSDLLFLNCGKNHYETVRDRGTIIMFPSFMIHQVTPLVSGTRYSLVGWVMGPPFK
jgi:PKHD-type hydroxylase